MMKESRKRNTRELTLCRVISDFRHCYHFRYPVKRTNTSNRGNKISGSDYDKFFSHFHLNFVYKLMKQAPRQKKKSTLKKRIQYYELLYCKIKRLPWTMTSKIRKVTFFSNQFIASCSLLPDEVAL